MAATLQPHSASLNSNQQNFMRTPLGEFKVGRTLGEGSYGKVKLIINLKSGEKLAMKIIKRFIPPDPATGSKGRGGQSFERRVLREANLTRFLQNPHIVPLRDCRITRSHFYLFHEYIPGAQLTDRIGRLGIGAERAAHYFAQIVDGIGYCHANFVVHRDIKVENIMIDVYDNVKIIDFGLANFFDQKNALKTFCGSLQYSAPEIMRGDPYIGPEVDIWSIGVVLFAMLTGTLPFDDPRSPGAWECVMSGKVRWRGEISPTPKSLITRLLDPDPKRRITMPEIARHPFLAEKLVSPGSYCPSDLRTLPLTLDTGVIAEMTTCLFQSEHAILQHLEAEMRKGREQNGSFVVSSSPLVAVYHLIASARGFREPTTTQTLPGFKPTAQHSEPSQEVKLKIVEQGPQIAGSPMRRNVTDGPGPAPRGQRSPSENVSSNPPGVQAEGVGDGNFNRKFNLNRRPRANTVGAPVVPSPDVTETPPTLDPAAMPRLCSDDQKDTCSGSEGNWDKASYKAKRASMYETYHRLKFDAGALPSEVSTKANQRHESHLAKRATLYAGLHLDTDALNGENGLESAREDKKEEEAFEENGKVPPKHGEGNLVRRRVTIYKTGKRQTKPTEDTNSSLLPGTEGEKAAMPKELHSSFPSASPVVASPGATCQPQETKPQVPPRQNDPTDASEPIVQPFVSDQRRCLDKLLSSYRAKVKDLTLRQSAHTTECTRLAPANLRIPLSSPGKKVTFVDQVADGAPLRANEIFQSLCRPPDINGGDFEPLPKGTDFKDGKVGIFKSPKVKPAGEALSAPLSKPAGGFDLVPGVPQVSITECLRSDVIKIAKVSISALSDQFLDKLTSANIEYEWLETAFDFRLRVPLSSIIPQPRDGVAYFLATVEVVHVTRARSSAILMTACQPGTVPEPMLPAQFAALVKSFLQTLI
ncbi:Serine/threonine-protein kinase [Massospora cicadina]|nr:Serine/threonine-protein kinase [Massospora cicadina]